jgi:hypothetical protein
MQINNPSFRTIQVTNQTNVIQDVKLKRESEVLSIELSNLPVFITLSLGNSYLFLSIVSNLSGIRTRLYSDSNSRQNDINRGINGIIPANNSLIFDGVFNNGLLQINCNPMVVGNVNELTYISINNLDGIPKNLQLTFEYINLEG